MNRVRLGILVSVLVVFVLGGVVIPLRGQSPEIHSFDELRGDMRTQFSWYRNKRSGDTVVHGHFRRSIESSSEFFLVEGEYLHGIRHGGWNFTADARSDAEKRKHPLGFAIHGEFNGDLPTGAWSFKTWKSGDTLQRDAEAVIGFQNGFYSGPITFWTRQEKAYENVTVEGFNDTYGLMDSLWIIRSTHGGRTTEERRRYRHGSLVSDTVRDLTDGSLVYAGYNKSIDTWSDSLSNTINPLSLSYIPRRDSLLWFNQIPAYNTITDLATGNKLIATVLNVVCGVSSGILPKCRPFIILEFGPNYWLARLRLCDSLIRHDPSNGEYHFRRGRLFLETRMYDSALPSMTRAIELTYHLDSSYYFRGDAYQGLKDHDKALADYAQSYENGYRNPLVIASLAVEYYYVGDYRNAIKYSSIAIDQNPSVSWAKYKIALCQLCLGELKKARESYVRAFQQQGFYELAVRELKEVAELGIQTKEAHAILRDVFGLSQEAILQREK